MLKVKKVTDPSKIVTDPVMLRELARQGIDSQFVEFFQDYAPRGLGSPYAKFYRDLKSGKQFMVASGLPMVNADGVKVEVGWEQVGSTYRTKSNQFSAMVTGKRATLSCINDQPWGAKKGEKVNWQPQLFLDDIKQNPASSEATLLAIDPINENYHNNVLEWDYGICKRRIRVIEGRFRERWIFPANPNGDVRIKHNFAGSLQMRLGYCRDAEGNPLEVLVTDDEELVPATAFAKAVYPVEVGAEQTFYPDIHPENFSVDGYAAQTGADTTWALLRAMAGSASDDAGVAMSIGFIKASTTVNQWEQIMRNFLLFPTFPIPSNAIITEAVPSVYGYGKDDLLGISPNYNVYSSNPASHTAITWSDYPLVGDTPLCDSPIGFPAWSIDGYNPFPLNAAGIAAISKRNVTELSIRTTYDAEGTTPPNWVSGAYSRAKGYCTEQGAGFKPKLVVTYTTVTSLETLRPNAPGDLCGFPFQGGDVCPDHYLNVDDEGTPDTNTWVGSEATPAAEPLYANSYELYNLENSVAGFGTINQVEVFFCCKAQDTPTRASAKAVIKTGGAVYPGDSKTVALYWAYYSQVWATNPATGNPWTWPEINALQAGVALRRCQPTGVGNRTYCTQVFVEVEYTPIVAPTVTTNPATDIEATTATGNGNITDIGGEDCDKRGFVYDTSPHGDPGNTAPADSEYANYVEETDSFGTGAFTGALTSLDPKTPYYVRAYAHNSVGYSYGDEVSFTTLAAIPTVTTDAATGKGAIAATLNGTLDSDGGEVCDCGFEWGPDVGKDITTPTESKTKGQTFSQVIGGLAPNTTYHFEAFATNSAGTGYGANRSFTTRLIISKAYALAREEL